MKSYENALRNECGYQGAQPYVFLLDYANITAHRSWTVTAIGIGPRIPTLRMCKSCCHSCLFHLSYSYCTRIPQSPIWDPLTGFGGDGVPGTYTVPTDPDPTNSSGIIPHFYHGCVKDGPFADYTLKLGPGLLVTEHCIARGVGADSTVSSYLNSTAIAYVLSFPTFEQFRLKLEGTRVPFFLGPHGGGHGAIGGEMSNYFSSPGGKYLNTRKSLQSPICFYADPLFYMHHTSIDRIWWRWQEECPEHLYEISGVNSTSPPYGNVTLNYPLQMGNVGPTILIRDIMDTRKEPSCYIYV